MNIAHYWRLKKIAAPGGQPILHATSLPVGPLQCVETSHEAPQKSAKPSRADSKQAQVLAMLHRKQGATIAAVMQATDWQPHSVRGFLTAVVCTKLGLTLVSEKTGEARVFRIVANDVSPKRKGRPGRKAA
jgi:hypothetical protein